MKLNLIMPMGGGGTRFGNHGFELPKPLIPIYDKPFFYWATRSVEKFVELKSITFVVLQEHIDRFGIDAEIKRFYPEARIVVIPEILPGAVLTCKAGADAIPDGVPMLFNDCDHLFTCQEFYDFCKEEKFATCDGALLTFKSDEDKFSYVAYGEDGLVNRTVEKEVISNDAICGAYYFKDKKTFLGATEEYLTKCAYKEFFVSGVYNVMADHGKKIVAMHTDGHVSFGTPDEYDFAKKDETYLKLV
ncbi:MAG: dolichyl-phosphate mannose synthase [Pseudobutyrivibrio sp.]|nr:dolichyl-phosphate mannose synthase [Pseudobutyrivibrio sp.]